MDKVETASGDQALQVDGLRVAFGDFVAIPNLSFLVNFGEVHGVIGPNGAGKTTLLDAITGKTRPAEGRILLDRHTDLLALDEPKRALAGVGRKFQKPSVFEALSVRENLELALRLRPRSILGELRNWSDPRRKARADEVLEEIGLAARAETPAGALAHGQKQWLEIGMLLMQRPKLLMLDEPVAGMTATETAHTAELIRRLRRRMLEDLRAGVAASRGLDLAETADCLVRASMRHHANRPELARVLEFLEQTLPLDAETAEVKAQIQAEIVAVLALHGVAEIETAAFDLSALTKGMVEAAVQAGEQDYEALAARVSRAARGYLGV